jgi:hypothetical protein
LFSLDGDLWVLARRGGDAEALLAPRPWYPSLGPLVGSEDKVRDVARHAGEVAIAAESGLYLGDGTEWKLALPAQGSVR